MLRHPCDKVGYERRVGLVASPGRPEVKEATEAAMREVNREKGWDKG